MSSESRCYHSSRVSAGKQNEFTATFAMMFVYVVMGRQVNASMHDPPEHFIGGVEEFGERCQLYLPANVIVVNQISAEE